jgi:RHS repeat-associated protein
LWGAIVDQLFADEQITNPLLEGNTIWPLGDHLGTLRDLADFDGTSFAISNHRVYDSFGKLTSETNSAVDTFFAYTGKYFDRITGLSNHWHRWYDPQLGKWISEDPIGFLAGDANLARYVGNMVSQFTDPTGLIANDDRVVKRLPKGYWARDAADEIERINGLSGIEQTLELPWATFQAIKLIAGSGALISAAFQEGRDQLNEIRESPDSDIVQVAAATTLRFTFVSEVSEVGVQVANSVGQSGPFIGAVSQSRTATTIFTNPYLVRTAQGATTFRVGNDLWNGEFNSEHIAQAIFVSSLPYSKGPKKGDQVFRVYGGDSKPDGASWTPVNPGKVPDFRNVAGLPSGGDSGANNTARFVIEGTLQDPSKVVKIRKAKPLDGNSGGLTEYIIPDPLKSGAVKVLKVGGVNPEF